MMKTKIFCILSAIAIFITMNTFIVNLVRTSENNQIEGESQIVVYESEEPDHNTITSPANVPQVEDEIVVEQTVEYSKNLNESDQYLLAKIVMAEAEGESFQTKLLIIFTILNRVDSNKFPNTIEGVIFQNSNGVYQFSPVSDGRWSRIEPNKECWEAVNVANATDYDPSAGALFFEACSGESWHSRNLEFICQSDNTRFYK